MGKPISWHEKNCPCGGKPQPVSKSLRDRQKLVPSSGHLPTGVKTSFFRKPGSQNSNK